MQQHTIASKIEKSNSWTERLVLIEKVYKKIAKIDKLDDRLFIDRDNLTAIYKSEGFQQHLFTGASYIQ